MTRKKSSEVPGNARGSQALFDRELIRLGTVLLQGDHRFTAMAEEGMWIKAVKIQAPTDERAEWLVVVTVETESDAIVGFGNGDSFSSALTGTLQRIRNGSIKWQEDKPYGS